MVVDNPNGEDGAYGFLVKDFGLMDYYTGTVFPSRDTAENDGYDVTTDIVWEDTTYSVGYSKLTSWNYGDWQIDGSICSQFVTGYNEIVVTAPADYDGLIFYTYNKGITEYQETDNENLKDAHTFELDEGETMDDYTFIRISDYVTSR